MKSIIVNIFHYLYFIFYFVFFRKESKRIINRNSEITYFTEQSKVAVPYKIWIFWYDIDIPELVGKCINNIKKLHPEYQVYVLDKETVSDFVDLNVKNLIDKMPVANLSDLIRLKLLQQYGGVWMDALIILEKNIKDFFILQKIFMKLSDSIMLINLKVQSYLYLKVGF